MRRLLIAIFGISAAAIAYEILLMRVLSIVQWHHFAWMIISLALLGYGASGTAIALLRERIRTDFLTLFSSAALLFSVSMIVCLYLGQRVPFNALEVVWDPWQLLYLAELYLLFMLPFFFAAVCIGLAFTMRRELIGRIYFCDLLGAGVGAALIIALLFLVEPQRAVVGLASLALLASYLASGVAHGRPGRVLSLAQLVWLLCLLFALPADRIGLRVSEFKSLSQSLEVVDARVLAQRSGPLGLLTVVESPRVPFRHAPGLSLAARSMPPNQLAVFSDADALSAINRFDGRMESMAYLGDLTAALPYALLDRPRVAVLGAGAGADVLLALYHGARQIDAVELNPQLTGLLLGDFADYSGHLFEHERVSLHVAEARGFVVRQSRSYDLIQVALVDSPAVSGAGVQALGESYLYTVEAITRFLAQLEPDGLLAITRWLQVPPRDSLKVAATLIEALRGLGVAEPGRCLAVIRNWNTATLLVKNGDFSMEEIDAIRQFAQARSFDVAWYPSMPAAEANRFNRLEHPWVYEGIKALLGPGQAEFLSAYKFNVHPATDDRPYFFNFFKWRVLPELFDLRARGGAGLVEWGYLVLMATLLQAILAGAVLILLPLLYMRRSSGSHTARYLGGYFFLLGLAFMFVEMAFIQKFILFLSHPLYSVAVVLAGFLVFAGLGSAASEGLVRRLGRRFDLAVPAVVGCIAAFVLLYLWLLPMLFTRWVGLPDAARVSISLGLIAPLAFCMGMPFPLGLRRLGEVMPGFIPWAWGLNGFASVVSAALATLLAIEFGFSAVLVLAVLLYALAASVFAGAYR